MALDREQQKILNAIIRGSKAVAPGKRNKYIRAAVQTGLVESGLRNLNRGDQDSLGWRQERTSIYGQSATNVNASVRRFFQEAAQHDRGQPSWQLAADVQRPAEQYRGRYKDVAGQAAGLLKGIGLEDTGSAGGGSQQTQPDGLTVTGRSGFDLTPGPDTTGLLASLLGGQDSKPQIQSAGLQAPAYSARATTPQGYQGILSSGGPAPKQDNLSGLLEAISGAGATIPGVTAPQVVGDAQNGGGKLAGSTKRAGRPKAGLRNAVNLVDSLISEAGAPITAKQEPGHAAGGDHDPAVKGATARDIGGDETTRKRIWSDLMRQLGVRGATYKGQDVNVTKGGVRYQVISRDHGTGPHLHVGLRRTR